VPFGDIIRHGMLVPERSIHRYALVPVLRRHYPDYEAGSVPSTIISRAPEPLKVAPDDTQKPENRLSRESICPRFVFVRHTLGRVE
jgi:hypothetical protein